MKLPKLDFNCCDAYTCTRGHLHKRALVEEERMQALREVVGLLPTCRGHQGQPHRPDQVRAAALCKNQVKKIRGHRRSSCCCQTSSEAMQDAIFTSTSTCGGSKLRVGPRRLGNKSSIYASSGCCELDKEDVCLSIQWRLKQSILGNENIALARLRSLQVGRSIIFQRASDVALTFGTALSNAPSSALLLNLANLKRAHEVNGVVFGPPTHIVQNGKHLK
ncbi:Hypothetical predicted protein [Cloeon dipterum]|uniref:Uncharacterized protein n=1 Tax=Cloeon dipterum TaxID=197152 RepID=A0A8S1D289_9INSE|nr:Hypothetical predicted protein [Cloeon dipterum]